MINVNNFKPGITFSQNNEIYIVMEAKHSKQGRGQANVKAKVKNLRTGSTTILSYVGGDKVEKAHIDKKYMNYLYNDGNNIILMDEETFEQIEMSMTKVEWELNFLKDGDKVMVRMYNSEILGVELPTNLEFKVTTSPEAVKGNTQSNPQKKITIETGFEMEAPMFIKESDIIVVSTETGKYVGRGQK